MPLWLQERLTFDKLFRISEPKRVYRSFTVRGPPLEIDSYQDAVYYTFNFKSNPSTTGLRHRGYVKFFKPLHKNPRKVPLQHLDCLVDCSCPDYRYKWAWANKQRQSSVVGPQSLNQAWNKAPRKTNPSGAPGLCKHILATRQFIYGLLSSFPGDTPDTAHKLNQLTKFATKRWTDFEGQSRAAKEKEAEIRRRREQRNLGQLPITPQPLKDYPDPEDEEEFVPDEVNTPSRTPKAQKPKATGDLKQAQPEPLPVAEPPGKKKTATATPTELAIPPGQRGRGFPPSTSAPTPKPKRVIGNRKIKPLESWIRPSEVALCAPIRDLILESVVKPNGEFMNPINEALKLVEEMEADELSHLDSGELPPTDMGIGSDIGGDTLEMSEPPVSDSAIGADTEGDSALSLLRSMKNSLEQIAGAVAPVEEIPPGAEGAGGGVPGAGGDLGAEGGDLPMPDEPPADIEGAAAAEAAAEDEGGEGDEEEPVEDDDADDDDGPPAE